MEIIIPSIKEAKAALGSDAHSFSKDYLSDRRLPELVSAIRDTGLDIDDRFNCALELRNRSLADSAAGQSVINSLFTLVENSTKPSKTDGTPGFTIEEKRVGIMAAIALQGSISDSPIHLSIAAEWIQSGILAIQDDHRIEQAKWFNKDLVANNADWRAHDIKNERDTNQAYRALVMLAGTTNETAIFWICSSLRDRRLPDSFKVFAIHALTGISEKKQANEIGATFSMVLGDLNSSDWLRHQVLQSWAIFRPRNTMLDAVISKMNGGLERMITSASLELDETSLRLGKRLQQAVARAQSPHFSPDQAEEARRYIGAEVWRPILHLKDFNSILLNDPFSNVLHEILPAGARGDLFTFESLRQE